jgi:hypothetical protein
MAPGSIIPIIVAAHAAKVRRLLEAFRVAGATAPERARTLDALGVVPDGTLADFKEAGIIRPGPGAGTWYLDEGAHAARTASHTRGTKVVLLVLLAILIVGLVVLLTVRPTVI